MGRGVLDVSQKKESQKHRSGSAGQQNPCSSGILQAAIPETSLPPVCVLKETRQHRKSIFTLILHMEIKTQKSTKLPMEELLLLGLNCLLTNPKDQPFTLLQSHWHHQNQVRNRHKFAVIPFFSVLSFMALLAPPHVLSPSLRKVPQAALGGWK